MCWGDAVLLRHCRGLLPVVPAEISFPVGPVDSPALSVGGPPPVPSRILVVLVEEAKAEGTPCLGCPGEDQDMRLLAGVAKAASGTACIDSLGSPCVGETLSSTDITGRLLLVVPAGISFPVGPVDRAGPNGPYVAGDPVGPYGTLSPSDSDPAGLAGPYVAGGPVGTDGTLSPFFSDPAGFVGGPVGPSIINQSVCECPGRRVAHVIVWRSVTCCLVVFVFIL